MTKRPGLIEKLVTPYGDINLGQHWLRYRLVAKQHQAINWTNVDLLSVRSRGIYLRVIIEEIRLPLITKISLKMYLKIIQIY